MTPPVPPQSLEAERAVLGALLLEPSLLPDVLDLLHPDDFYKEAHRTIFSAMTRLSTRSEPVDVITVIEELRKDGVFEEIGGHSALAVLQEAGTVATQLTAYTEIVRDRAARRRLMQVGRELTVQAAGPDGSTTTSAIVATTVSALLALETSRSASGILTPEQFAASMVQTPADPGLRTGLRILDEACDGLRRGNLVVIAGRPGMGKTALGIQIAHQMGVVDHHPVLFATLEMRIEEIWRRLHGVILGKSTQDIRAGRYEPGECARGLAILTRSQFHIWDATAPTVTEVSAQIRRAVIRHQVAVVIVDHLGKMRGTRRDNRYLEVGELAQGLKATAKQLGVPIIALHQLNRDVEHRDSPRPRLADLRDSGNVEEEADAILFLWTAEDHPERKDPLPVNLYLAKNRHGETANVVYLFQKRLGRFVEASNRAGGG